MTAPNRLGRVALVCVAILVATQSSSAQPRRLPESLTDREFWQFFTTMSEDAGTFPSENFVSNEKLYQYVIPSLQRTLTPNGVYLGVGPEQNFTYIVNFKPRMAVIFDIRRENAMVHLMYKALFELSATRAEFVSHLFSRPLPRAIDAAAKPEQIFTALAEVTPTDSAFAANWSAISDRLTKTHGFALSSDDLGAMRHVFTAFFVAGPEISYAYHVGMPPTPTPWLVTFAQLQSLTNADSVNMAFLATEESYRWMRAFELKNLVVPVVGDFGGPKAIRGVAGYLRERNATVTAFYVSNVEQYLFQSAGADRRFYESVGTLPLDSTSAFIRSLPSNGPGPVMLPTAVLSPPNMTMRSVQIVDSAGLRIIIATGDSAGKPVTVRVVSTPPPVTLASTSAFVSGTASIRGAVDAFIRGQLATYAQVTASTKTDGWNKPPR